MFTVYIKGGAQLLRSPGGEHIPMLRKTIISQEMKDPGECEFEAFVNHEGLVQYDALGRRLFFPSGEILPAEVTAFYPKSDDIPYDRIVAKCVVSFPYDTVNGD